MKESSVIKALTALSQVNRLRVFRRLIVAGRDGATPTAIAEQTGLQLTNLSFHLKELTNAGLVTQQRNGRNLIYRAHYARMDALLAYLSENCCQGEPSSQTTGGCGSASQRETQP